eukprot:267972-Pleurochrysis_carterae.AAC.1
MATYQNFDNFAGCMMISYFRRCDPWPPLIRRAHASARLCTVDEKHISSIIIPIYDEWTTSSDKI